MKRYVVYTRVSTQEQKRSGLGLEAQERDIGLYLQNYSDEPWEVVGRFSDTGSGASTDRPEFGKAVALAKKVRAELLVSKLDRLSRRVSVIAGLMEEKGLKFRVASMPHADPFQLHVYAALAEQERQFIAARTRAALAVAKSKGKRLGGYRGAKALQASIDAVQGQADAYAKKVGPTIRLLQEQGRYLREIAEELEALGIKRPRGGRWSEMAVRRVLARMPEANDGEA
jgi:DNA invertase Pin-like site-specific DNA recombinase